MDRRLTCIEALRRLDDYLDRELPQVDVHRVEAHLRECEMCAKEFGFERALVDQVRAKLSEIEMPQHLRGRVLAALARIA